jgi:hypothetical protein
VEVELLQDVTDRIGRFTVLVDAIECAARSLNRQRRNFESFETRGDGGDAGGHANTNVAEPGQLIHNGVDLLRARPLWIENGFGALSSTMTISFEDRYRRKDVRSSGFSMPAPMTVESRRRK